MLISITDPLVVMIFVFSVALKSLDSVAPVRILRRVGKVGGTYATSLISKVRPAASIETPNETLKTWSASPVPVIPTFSRGTGECIS